MTTKLCLPATIPFLSTGDYAESGRDSITTVNLDNCPTVYAVFEYRPHVSYEMLGTFETTDQADRYINNLRTRHPAYHYSVVEAYDIQTVR